ncbi:MAG TPA: peptidoglycan-associated lipoprotein [Elusimicrobia bacterium]|nr:peptidoglycan-associated lipoprotein [Elusimicrobiota bacterium]
MTKNLILTLAVALLAAACTPKKGVLKGSSGVDGAADGTLAGLSYSEGDDMSEGDIRDARFQGVPELEKVFFDYDQYNLTAEATATLRANAAWLKQHPEFQFLIEGHADERGTAEYNLALGQKRAKIVREYYVSAGVTPGSIGTISYGKERPDCTDGSEGCDRGNRRAVTLIATKKP